MKQILLLLCFLLTECIIHAQHVGIGTTNPLARLHVADSSVVFSAPPGLPEISGSPPVQGPGNRLMWYPDKAAFRVGAVSGYAWDKDSIGYYSFASGLNAKAKGTYSTAMGGQTAALDFGSTAIGFGSVAAGYSSVAIGFGTLATGYGSSAFGRGTIASGEASTALGDITIASGLGATAMGLSTNSSGSYSTAMGYITTASGFGASAMGSRAAASGEVSTALGNQTIASGPVSTAMGQQTTASGYVSTAMGYFAFANADFSTAIGLSARANAWASIALGRHNDTIVTVSNTWIPTEPLLIVGNGTGSADKKNALVILKNGNTGIGLNNPTATVEVARGTGDLGTAAFHGTNHISHFSFGPDEDTYIRAGKDFGNVIINDIIGGKVGVGTNAPLVNLHVFNGSSGNVTPFGPLVVESANNTYINLLSPNANETGVLFGKADNAASGAIVYNNTNTLNGFQFRTNGNQTKMVLDNTGKVGIGTSAPAASLEVNGYTKLGSDAPSIKVKKLTGTTDADEGGFTQITDGLDPLKILSISVMVGEYTIWYGPNIAGNGTNFYWVRVGNVTNIHNVFGDSAYILSKPIKILITYEE